MRYWPAILVLAIVAVPADAHAQRSPSDLIYSPPNNGQTISDQAMAIFKHLIDNPEAYHDELANPIATNDDELRATVRRFTKLHAFCAYWQEQHGVDGKRSVPIIDDVIDRVEFQTNCMVTMTGVEQAPGHLFSAIDLATCDDKSIVYLQTKIGLPRQRGYVYLHTFPSVESMPDVFRRCFDPPTVRGVTLLCRYIILIDDISLAMAPAVRWRSLNRHLSHELAHAYLNCCIGSLQADSLPTWFNEGLALTASKTGDDEYISGTSLGGEQALSTSVTKDYKEYYGVFQYTEHTLGRPAYYHMLRECCMSATVHPFLMAMQARSYSELRDQYLRHRRNHRLTVWGSVIGVVLFLLLFPFDKLHRRAPVVPLGTGTTRTW